jgi:hypothetical protein
MEAFSEKGMKRATSRRKKQKQIVITVQTFSKRLQKKFYLQIKELSLRLEFNRKNIRRFS